MKPYPVEFREQIVRAMAGGLSESDVILRYGVSPLTIRRWRQQWEEKGNVALRPRPGRPRLIDGGDDETLRLQLQALPNGTLTEHCAAWERSTGFLVSPCTMSRALRRLGWSGRKATGRGGA